MEKIRYLIIGAGFGGIGMGIRLKQTNEMDFQIWEKAGDLGGCWRDNTYPGAACDVPSHLYSYSFAPKADWSHKFAPQAEIHAYQKDCVNQFRLMPHIRFNKMVKSAAFDEDKHLWTITDQNGNSIQTQFLITATGQLNRPAFPNIEGLDAFKGPLFHSAQWQHDVDFTNKNVAVIGTGASAIQFVPQIAKQAKHISLFQRSAPYVIAKPDRAYSKFEQTLYKRLPFLLTLSRLKTYLLFESRFVAFTSMRWLMPIMQWQWKRFMQKEIKDPKKRKQLTPDYTMGCKRILISNDYYPTLNAPHVDIIDTGIQRITQNGIIDKQGNEILADIIVLGTGFTATEFLSPMCIAGTNQTNLNDAWKDGAEAYLGLTVNQFPNLFMLYGPNTNLGHNSILYMLESQIHYILSATQAVIQQQCKAINIKDETQNRFNKVVQEKLNSSVWSDGCTSWYKTKSGKNTANWPSFTFQYRKLSKQFSMSDYEIT